MNRRFLAVLATASLLVAMVPLIGGAATSIRVFDLTVAPPADAAWIQPGLEYEPSGRGNCDGWEIRNNQDLFAGGPPESELAIRITPPDPDDTPYPFAEAIAAGQIFFLADVSTNTSRGFRWGTNEGPGGDPPEGALVDLDLTRNLSECHDLEGDYQAYEATFGAPLETVGPVSADVVLGSPADGCSALAAATGDILLLQRGVCPFTTQYENAQTAGAVGLIVYNNAPGSPVLMDGTVATATIPALMIGQADGVDWAAALGAGFTLDLTLGDTPSDTIDGPTWPGPATLGATSAEFAVTLSWPSAIEGDNDLAGYMVYQDTVLIETLDELATGVLVSGLQSFTEYDFDVVAFDVLDLESDALSTSVTTLAAPEWPVDAELLVEITSQTTATLSWPAAIDPDDGLAGYRVYRDDVEIADLGPFDLDQDVSGLTSGETYTFAVEAYDTDGLTSPLLNEDGVTQQPPYWPGGAELGFSNLTGTSVLVSWPAALDDDGTIASYQLYWDGSPYGSPTTSTSMTVTGNLLAATHDFAVVATDNDANTSPMLEGSVDGRVPATTGAFDPATGRWFLLDSQGNETTFYYGNPGDYPFMGDWDCDGVDTPGLYRQSNGFVYLRNSNDQGNAEVTFFFGNPGDIPLAGDFNNDGCDTVSVYRPSSQRFFIVNQLGQDGGGLGQAEVTYIFGNPGDKPFVGDFDGDGIATVGLHRESSGLVYFRNSHTQGNADAEFFFGNPGDRLISGDWGLVDGEDTPALFRPSSRIWYFRHSNTQGNADAQFFWGQSQWLPVSGRFGLD